ncbi:MAG: leucine-rich repeat domain-containing protein [Promethearchaeota archaeon]
MKEVVENFLKSYLKDKEEDFKQHVSGRFNNLHYFLNKLNIKVDNEFITIKKDKFKWIDILNVRIDEKHFLTHSRSIGGDTSKLYLAFYITKQQPLIMKLKEGRNPDLEILLLDFFNSFISKARAKETSEKKIKMIEHAGDLLNENDYHSLKFLEKRLGCTIPNCSTSIYPNQFSFGYRSEKGTIIFLNLSNFTLNKRTCDISGLPFEIIQMKGIQELYLSNLNIRKVPIEINELNSLRILHIFNCSLEELPDSIGEIYSLQELNLNNNNLRKLPVSIENLENLTSLSIENNKLKELPISLLNLPNLKELNLAGNPIKYNIDTMKNL